MSDRGLVAVKCEPPPEEDAEFLYSYNCPSNQLPSNEVSAVNVKLEAVCRSQDVSTNLLQHLHSCSTLEDLAPLAPAGPAATPVCIKQERADTPPTLTLETLESASQYSAGSTFMDRHNMKLKSNDSINAASFTSLMAIKDEPLSEGEQHHLSGEDTSDSCSTQPEVVTRGSPKSWTQRDMENALDALRKHNMSLTKASATYGIPSTTLWQRAHRLGIDTPKKEGAAKSWSEDDLKGALQALRAGAISANKASKAYGIPSSTLYKIARREGIRLSAPFNAAPTAWRRADLRLALASIRCGACSVQRAASHYGIPTGTLYGRCKREGIELSRANPTPWSENAMVEALEAVRIGQMSINQAAIHFNLPYSSLYGRFKRCKYQNQIMQTTQQQDLSKSQEAEQHLQDIRQYQHTQPHVLHPAVHDNHAHAPYTVTQQYVHEDTSSMHDYGQGVFFNQHFSSIVTS